MSNGRSGIRITSAPPASPECSAIQPAWRPITSTTITRLWLSAVVCSRSIASVAICTAVSKPNVRSVPPRSLSIVFGTPSTGSPCSPCSRAAAPSVSSPPIAISPSMSSGVERPRIASGPVVALERVGARGAEDRAAAGQDAARRLDRQLLVGRPSSGPRQPSRKPTISCAVVVDALADDRADDRVQAGAVAAAGEHADAHAAARYPARQNAPLAARIDSIRRAGLAWRSRARCRGLSGCLGDGGGDEPTRIAGRHRDGLLEPAARTASSAAAASAVVAGERLALADARRARRRPAGAAAASCRRRARAGEPWDPGAGERRTPTARPTTRARSPTSASSTSAAPPSRCRSPTTPGCSRSRPATASRASRGARPDGPRAGPERYYPAGERSFVRLGPKDLLEAESLLERVRAAGADAHRDGLRPGDLRPRAGRPRSCARARRDGLEPVGSEEYRGQRRGDPRHRARASPRLVRTPSYTLGVAGSGTGRLLGAIDAQLPGVPLFAASGILAARESLVLPAGPARIEALGPALSPERAGYEAMRLVLDAVEQGGATAAT